MKNNRQTWNLYRRVALSITLTVFFFPLATFADENIYAKHAENTLNSMPTEDRQDLECLFLYLMADGDFAYTLFGDKPMALSDFYIDLESGFFLTRSTLNSVAIVYKGWLVWQKYKSSFPSISFILADYMTPDYKLTGFVLYHKQKVQALYDKHQPLMKMVFGDVDHIAKFLCTPTLDHLKLGCDKHMYHQALGLLLGYDERNAKKFRDKFELIDALMKGPFALEGLNAKMTKTILLSLQEKKPLYYKQTDFKESKSSDIIQQLNGLCEHLKVINLSLRDATLSPFKIPKYMVFEGDQEVLKTQNAYDKIRDKLNEIYFSDNFLEIILSRLQS